MQLLVSVRDLSEARAALAGGADVIDLKEPANGPLGMVSPEVMGDVIREIRQANASVQLSAALGEVADWTMGDLPIPVEIDFCKLGLSRLESVGGFAEWCRVRERLRQIAISEPGWIAVCYADFIAASAPPPDAVLSQAIETDCKGILFDTWDKSSGNLWTHLSPREIASLIVQAHAAGLVAALAGKLGTADIGLARELGADIFAVRSATCAGHDRTGQVCPRAVAELKRLTGA